jgi:hypothetical protein
MAPIATASISADADTMTHLYEACCVAANVNRLCRRVIAQGTMSLAED